MRFHHLDNLRAAMVLCVVALHVFLAYHSFAPWWYAADPDNLPGVEIAIFLLDSFPLPVLYFLAGFFGAASLARKTTRDFLRSKLTRLGLPMLLITVLLIPILPWVTETTRGLPTPGIVEFWMTFLSDGFVPQWMLVQEPPDYTAMERHFSQYHLWFISLLLVFYLLHVTWKVLAPRICCPTLSASRGLLMGALLICAAMAATGLFMHEWAWLNMGWLLFQPVRLPLYLGCYVLGTAAFGGDWLRNGSLPGPLWGWLLGTLVFTASYFAISSSLAMVQGPLPYAKGLLQAAIRTGLSFSWLGLLLVLFRKWGQQHGRMATLLARHSYAIYLLHMFPCVLLQAWLTGVEIPVLVKILLVGTGSLLCSIAVASLIRKATTGLRQSLEPKGS